MFKNGVFCFLTAFLKFTHPLDSDLFLEVKPRIKPVKTSSCNLLVVTVVVVLVVVVAL